MSNKIVGELLSVCDRTIEVHRAKVMKKMGAKSLPDLVQKYDMCQQAGLL
jgi:FixJ family two-component response regulator